MKIPKDFIAFDIETTGFAPPCKIIEIGAIKVVDFKIVEEFQTFVNPQCPIPGHITNLTGISFSMVADAPAIDQALPDFLSFAGNLPIAAHNASFDMRFICHYSKKLGYSINNQIIDTLALSRVHFPRLENHKLATIAKHVGVINEKEHRGLYDAQVVANILLKLSIA